MSVMIPLTKDEKETVVEILKGEIRSYREVLAKPDTDSSDYTKRSRWDCTLKLEKIVSALTKIESQGVEAAK